MRRRVDGDNRIGELVPISGTLLDGPGRAGQHRDQATIDWNPVSHVSSLGYLVLSVTNLSDWESYLSGVFGLQSVSRPGGGRRFRMDEKTYRFDLVPGECDSIIAVGWEVASSVDLERIVERIEMAGIAVDRPDPQFVLDRGVSGLVRFKPAGADWWMELYYGLEEAQEPFASPLGVTFVTGDMGLGHVLVAVSDEDYWRRLAEEILGLRLSDTIDLSHGTKPLAYFYHCNGRHHSLALAARLPSGTAVGHVMIEVADLTTVGRAWDKVVDGAATITRTLGQHSNDKMTSFYARTPSIDGLRLEYGCNGLRVDDATWVVRRYTEPHYWGHRTPQ